VTTTASTSPIEQLDPDCFCFSLDRDALSQAMKFDLRAHAYAGQVQWVAARLYQGQTTSFRTPVAAFNALAPGTDMARVLHPRAKSP
jgi:hypothetical protein